MFFPHYPFLVSDNSTFREVYTAVAGGFRLFNQFCVFINTQLLAILPASFLGDISQWDKYLHLDFDDETLPYKAVDGFLQDPNFSDLITRSKISTPRRFVSQAIAFYRHFAKLLLSSDLASSTFARGLSCFDEAVMRGGNEAHYTDSIHLLTSYFVQQKWISPHVMPVIVNEYCSLVVKLRAEKVAVATEWVSSISRHYELQSRLELFRFFKICSETLRSPCSPSPSFIVTIAGPKSDMQEFSSCVRSLQCSISSIQKVESLFLSSNALPRAYELVSQRPGLLHKRKFSVWHLLSSTYFHRIGIKKTLERYYEKNAPAGDGLCLVPEDKNAPGSSRSSSATGTPTKQSPEKFILTTVPSLVVRKLIDIPLPIASGADSVGSKKRRQKKISPVKSLPKDD